MQHKKGGANIWADQLFIIYSLVIVLIEVLNPKFIGNIEDSIRKTYQITKGGVKINAALHKTARHLKLYRYDPFGIKKGFAKITEPFVRLGVKDFFYDEANLDRLEEYKNYDRKEWINEFTLEQFNYSFDDI